MSEEYRSLEAKIKRMQDRKERATKAMADLSAVQADLQSIVAEVDTDITALQLELEALGAAGDSRDQ